MSRISDLSIKRFWEVFPKHLLGWSIFITYEVAYIYLMTGNADFWNYVLNYSLNIAFFYFNAHILLEHTLGKFKGSAWVTFLLILIEIILFLAIKFAINRLILGEGYMPKSAIELHKALLSNTIRTIYFLGFSFAYWFAIQTYKRNRKISELETQKLIEQNEKITLQKDLLQSRNAYLQAQVNPHLLFNTLNFMYNTSVKVSEKLAETVMNLSDMMRYALTAIDKDDKVSLNKEIEHIHNYIRLNQVRFDEKLNVDFRVEGTPNDLRIIPLALITLIENVFKYGNLHEPQHPAIIRINIQDRKLKLDINNKKRTNQRTYSHGTGIQNLKERLDIYYQNRYALDIENEETTYSLTLKLTLNE